MSKKAKVENYPEELVSKIVKAYTALGTEASPEADKLRDACLNRLSDETGKTVASLRMKLVKEGVYVKKTYVTKAGTVTETKDKIVQGIAKILGVTEDQLAGLENATKPTLNLIRGEFVAAQEALRLADEDHYNGPEEREESVSED